MQPSRNECANGSLYPNFVMKLGMSNSLVGLFSQIRTKSLKSNNILD